MMSLRLVKSIHKICVISNMKYSTHKKTVLGIETSCDDTAAGIVNTNREIIAESKYNQWNIHKKLGYSKTKNQLTSFPGGIIPNVAKMLHHDNLIYAVNDCIEKCKKGWNDIDAIALTLKPGLEPCLWEGIKFTKLLLKKYELPFIGIHHMESHALTCRLFDKNVNFPFLTLLISGGHCILALVENENKFSRLGETIDLSPGNIIDKIARKLGLFEQNDQNLSGGALIEKHALNGNENSFPSIINMVKNFCLKNKDCNFSFTGFLSIKFRLIDKLITTNGEIFYLNGSERRILKKEILENVCASVQNIITIQLLDRLKRALVYLKYENIPVEHVVVSGGVAANKYIKSNVEHLCLTNGFKVSFPPASYCTDNGVMIAWNGCENFLSNSSKIILPNEQTEEFYDKHLRPESKCELGEDFSYKIKLLNIKI